VEEKGGTPSVSAATEEKKNKHGHVLLDRGLKAEGGEKIGGASREQPSETKRVGKGAGVSVAMLREKGGQLEDISHGNEKKNKVDIRVIFLALPGEMMACGERERS